MSKLPKDRGVGRDEKEIMLSMCNAVPGRITPSVLMVALAALVVAVSSCSAGTGPSAPTEARIAVDGDDLFDLQLVISRNFVQIFDPETQAITEVILQADTIAINGLYDQVLPLTALGGIIVELINPDPEVKAVRLRVWIDGRSEFDQAATLSAGALLRFIFLFNGF